MTRFGTGMVVAAQPEAVEAGVDALRAGGNAVDAAVACALVAGMAFAGACLEAGVKGADTAYTVKDWKPIATRYGLLTGSDVIKVRPAVNAWWLTGGGSAASLQTVIRKALI